MKNIKFLFVILTLTLAFSSLGQAQTLNLTTLGGDNFSLQSQKGKVVVLAVGATWLPLSKNQALITNKLAKKYAGRDVVIYFVATDSAAAKSKNFATSEQIQTFAALNKMTASILRDSDGAATLKKFKIDQLPAFLVFDKDGKTAAEAYGGLTPNAEDDLTNQIAKKIDEIL
jgi:thiol-disulfide isomerase/thioredoxin